MSISLINRITINPEVAHGKPTIRNKRYTVEGLLEFLAGGDSIEDLLKEFPDLVITKDEDFLDSYCETRAIQTYLGKAGQYLKK